MESCIFTHALRHTVYNVSDFIEAAPSVADLKDAESGKYLLTNQFEKEFSGLEPHEHKGLTIRDISMSFLTGSQIEFADKVQALDEQVRLTQCPLVFKKTSLTAQGFVRILNLIKMPILGIHHKTIAILTYNDDLTNQYNLFELFSLYRQHYSPKQAIKQFLSYLKLDLHFTALPTQTEVLVLIGMCLDSRHKQVAKPLKIQPKTVTHHISSLSNKLKNNIDLHTLLRHFRNYENRYTHPTENWTTR